MMHDHGKMSFLPDKMMRSRCQTERKYKTFFTFFTIVVKIFFKKVADWLINLPFFIICKYLSQDRQKKERLARKPDKASLS